MNDVKRLLSIIHEAPLPFEKTDSQLAQEYRNWFYGVRSDRLKAAELRRGWSHEQVNIDAQLKDLFEQNGGGMV